MLKLIFGDFEFDILVLEGLQVKLLSLILVEFVFEVVDFILLIFQHFLDLLGNDPQVSIISLKLFNNFEFIPINLWNIINLFILLGHEKCCFLS